MKGNEEDEKGEDDSLSSPYLSTGICAIPLVIMLLTVLAYCCFNNSLSNSFTFDDHLAIVNNKDVNGMTATLLWSNDIWGKDMRAHDSHKSYRPLLIATFQWIGRHMGKDPRAFRCVAILAHLATSFIVYILCNYVVFAEKDRPCNQSGQSGTYSRGYTTQRIRERTERYRVWSLLQMDLYSHIQ